MIETKIKFEDLEDEVLEAIITDQQREAEYKSAVWEMMNRHGKRIKALEDKIDDRV